MVQTWDRPFPTGSILPHAQVYRAWTQEQKEQVLSTILLIWNQNPELRLGQLLLNAAQTNLYSIEDFDLLALLQKIYSLEKEKEEENGTIFDHTSI